MRVSQTITTVRGLLLRMFLASISIQTASAAGGGQIDSTPTLIAVTDEEVPYYVVIGAFSIEGNAHKLIAQATNQWQYPAQYAFNYKRQLFYVYVLKTTTRNDAYQLAITLQATPGLQETWVYHGTFGVPSLSTQADRDLARDTDPVTQENVVIPQKPTTANDSTPAASLLAQQERQIIFKTFRWLDQKPVGGIIKAFDKHSAALVGVYPSNTPSDIQEIASNIANITFVADIFGYRMVVEKLNDAGVDPASKTTEMPFELERLKKGDIANLAVSFPDQAAIFTPTSADELNRLLEMMNENRQYKIIIHAHTYFGDKRKLMLRSNKGDFFDLTKAVQSHGSGKKLAQARGELIRDYLRSQHIDANRIQVKAWGDKKPIYGRQSEQFKGNERTEVEIIRD